MSNRIPIQNVYYLLAYAWDYFREGEEVHLSSVNCPDIHNLLTSVLCNGIRQLATRGIDKGYQPRVEETPRLRGKIDVLKSYQRMTNLAGRMLCEFDELTSDTIPNQILRTTCEQLGKYSLYLSKVNQVNLRRSIHLLRDISTIRLTRGSFYRVQLHRNNRHYRFLLSICRLLSEVLLPEEKSGELRFRNILEDEVVMNRIFERFVLRFASRHCVGARVRSMNISWVGEWDSEVDAVLPGMKTDVTIEYPDKRTILDCKFYKSALVTRHDRHRLHSNHLYQLNAYLQNKSHEEGWDDVKGILLYPAVSHDLHLNFKLLGHQFRIESIDLDQPWASIHEQLLNILM